MVVRSVCSSHARPVMPWFWITSLAIITVKRLWSQLFSSQTEICRIKRLPALFDQLPELGEQRRGIVRAGRRLGMILHAENRFRFMAHPLDRLVVEIDAMHGDTARQRFCIHREARILRGDLDLSRFQILPRRGALALSEF